MWCRGNGFGESKGRASGLCCGVLQRGRTSAVSYAGAVDAHAMCPPPSGTHSSAMATKPFGDLLASRIRFRDLDEKEVDFNDASKIAFDANLST